MRPSDSPMRNVEHHLANFFANFPGFAYTFRLAPVGHGSFPFVSPGIEKLYGLKPEDVLGDMAALHALAHPEDAPRIIAALQASAQAMSSVHMEFRICRPGLAVRWAEFYSTPTRQDDGSTLWHGVMFDITERKRSDEVLNFIAQRGWHSNGESYLAGLARQLCETLGVDYVIIDKFADNPSFAETVALFAKGKVLPNMQYPLKGTPCENVMEGDLCRYPINVQQQFPDDDLLVSMGVESYIGQPLWNSSGKVIGLIAIMDSKPIQDVPFIESMLKLASTRVAAEMERDLSEQALTESHQFLQQVIDTVADPVFVKDRQHRWLMMNRAMCRFMGRPLDTLLGKSDYDFFPKEEARVFWEKDELVFTQGEENVNEEAFTDADGVTHTIVTSKTSFTDMHGEDILVGTIKDITVLKQTQLSLEETASRLNSVVRNIPDLVWMKDSAGVYLSCNHAFERFFGASESEIIGKTDYDFVDKELADFFRQKDIEAMDAGTTRINEEWITLAEDGNRVLLETRKVPVYGPGSKVIGVLGIGRDITGHKAAQQRMELLEHAIDMTADAIYLINKDLRFDYVNDTACNVLGYSRAELYAMGPLDIDPDVDLETLRHIMHDSPLNTRVSFETRHRTRDGRIFPVEVNGTHFERDGNKFSICVVRDLTAIRSAERQLTNFVANFPGFAFTFRLSPDGHASFPFASPGIETLYGLKPEDVKDDMAPLHALTHPEDRPRIEAAIAESARTLQPLHGESRICRPGSPERWIEFRSMPTTEVDGSIVWHGVMLDITERKISERQLSLLHSSLDHMNDTVLLVSEDARILYVNEGACHVLGYSRDQLQGMRIADIDPDYQLDIWPEHWLDLKTHRTLNFESRHQSSSGRIYPVDITANYVEFDGVGYNLGICRDISERKLAQEALLRSQSALENAQRIAHIGSWDVDMVNDVLTWSDETFCIWEIDKAKFKATLAGFLETVHPEDREKVATAYNQAIHNKSLYQVEHRLLFPDGRVKYIQERGEPYFDDDGRLVRFIGTALDITQVSRQRMLETQRHRVFERMVQGGSLTETLEQVVVYVSIANPDRQCSIMLLDEDGSHYDVVVAPSFPGAAAMGGTGIADSAACCVAARSGKPIIVDGVHQQPCWATCQRVCVENGVRACWVEPIVAASGQTLGIITVYLRQPASPESADLEMMHQASYLCSIAIERKKLESQMQYQASYDSLTDLPNRRLFSNRLREEIARAERSGGNVAILFIDLDYFKEVNDTLGHHYGDQLLIKVSQRIRQHVREGDIVARLGGDEFVVMMHELTAVAHLGSIAQNIIEVMTMPFHLEEHVTYTSASIGIASYPVDANNVTALMSAADQAMYTAKSKGRNCFSFFTPSMQHQAQRRLLLGNELREAISKEQLQIFLQPIVDIAGGHVVKAEALIRWKHPQHGMVPPDKFIPIAEDMGLIHEIGDWVFHQAVQAMQRWLDVCAADSEGCQISINVSARQFTRDDIGVSWIERLDVLGIPMQHFVIEITESLLLGDKTDVKNKLQRFRDVGMSVALDDFGTGYSSMAYLKKFNIDFLKIDRSFVRDLETDPNDRAIAEAIVVMAHKLGLKTIAEGVETEQQKAMLAEVGCDYVQGYFYAKPMPVEEFMVFVKKSVPN